MQRAWEQVGAVEAANQRLREAELARAAAATAAAQARRAAPATPTASLVLTAAAQRGPRRRRAGRTAVGPRRDRRQRRVPAAAQAPAFRRITRPAAPADAARSPARRTLAAFQGGLLDRLNAEPRRRRCRPRRPRPTAGGRRRAAARRGGAAATPMTALAAQAGPAATASSSSCCRPSWPSRCADADARRAPRSPPAVGPASDARRPAGRRAIRAPTSTGRERGARRPRATPLIAAVNGVAAGPPERRLVTLDAGRVRTRSSATTMAGQALGGVTVAATARRRLGEVVARRRRQRDVAELRRRPCVPFGRRPASAVPPAPARRPLAGQATLAGHVLDRARPGRARSATALASALPGIAGRPADDPAPAARRCMAYPRFRDPLFEPLRALSQDHVIPNIADLPPDSLTVMEPNRRFIEAYLAGVNHALARELLWREYPTDQRGTYFQVFWDTRDALGHDPDRDDIRALHRLDGRARAQTAPSGCRRRCSCWSIRGELLREVPEHGRLRPARRCGRAATRAGRACSTRTARCCHPILHARLEPDITLVGFDLSQEQARGRRPRERGDGPVAPGWFFVLMERPGEPRFGLDDVTPGPAACETLERPGLGRADVHRRDAERRARRQRGADAAPPAARRVGPHGGRHGRDPASSSPVLLARHASEMLP